MNRFKILLDEKCQMLMNLQIHRLITVSSPRFEHMANASSTDYYAHVQNYLNHYTNVMTWLDYCLVFKQTEEMQVDFFEMPRNSMWY